MTDAGGTNTVKLLQNVGEYSIYMVYNTEVSNGETIPIDGTNGVPGIKAEDKVVVLGGTNFTDEKSLWGATFSAVEYDETAMHFTVVDTGASDDDIAVVFMYIPQSDPFVGSA